MTYTAPGALPPEREPTPGWDQSLSNGAAGIALLHAGYAQTGRGDWSTAHQWAAAMTRAEVAAHPGASLFQGAPAVAYTLRTIQRLSPNDDYAAALAVLDDHVAALAQDRLDTAHQRIDRGQLPALREFDLIHGLTGIAVCLLEAGNLELFRDMLSYLVRLGDPIDVDEQRLPGWWTDNGPSDRPSPDWPGGHANLGLAHGISGPLTVLAAAARHGITVPGHQQAIDRIESFLDGWCCGSETRPWWPAMISAAEYDSRTVRQPGPQRPSWCSGTPGIARARQLTALAQHDPSRQRLAETALAACVADDRQLLQLNDGSVCHGWAGLVHTTAHAAADANPGSPLAHALPPLLARWRRDDKHDVPGTSHADPDGMLDGAAGIALTDLQTGTHLGTAFHGSWAACLLTAPPTPDPEGTR